MALSNEKHVGSNPAEINWTDPQLDGHKYVKIENSASAWWWAHGFPTHLQRSTAELFWCCKHCNQSGDNRKHIYNITKGRNAPVRHLKSAHEIERDTPSQVASLRRTQEFCLSMFRALLLRWIIHDNIAFRAVDSEHFRALLIYLEGRLEGNIGSRRSVRRWILDAYEKHKKGIKAKLAKSQSLIHFSFDLWTSRSLLSLNGIVAHFVDETFEARTFLLALPEQEDEHTGVNIADTVRNLSIDNWPIERLIMDKGARNLERLCDRRQNRLFHSGQRD